MEILKTFKIGLTKKQTLEINDQLFVGTGEQFFVLAQTMTKQCGCINLESGQIGFAIVSADLGNSISKLLRKAKRPKNVVIQTAK